MKGVGEGRVAKKGVGEGRIGERKVWEKGVGQGRVGEGSIGERRVGERWVGEDRDREQRWGWTFGERVRSLNESLEAEMNCSRLCELQLQAYLDN